jgi:outer membrane protein assembly factor BamB
MAEGRKKGKLRVWRAILTLVAFGAAIAVIRHVPMGRYDLLPDSPAASPSLPLDPDSPWPKFRANALQNGRSPVRPVAEAGARPWAFQTGKGIFSSPVVDGEGNLYVGSADHVFYSLDKAGKLRWKLGTGEIIDSSALLDDRGKVYFGSGDQEVWCADRRTGEVAWKFRAQSVEEVKAEFGITAHNLSWFEGNIGLLPDGSLLAPNDNYVVYRLDRESGTRKGQYLGNEMVWSLPAVNPATGRLFFGSDFMALKNVFAYDFEGRKPRWTAGGLGTVAATPLLTGSSARGAVVLGGFDGYVRAFAQDSGKQLWKFGTRDHIYASPAQLSDGTIIQPSADGSVYALDPKTGRRKWAFDSLEPIRSSPAVDGEDRIYVGTGDGRLVCLEPDGRLRWSWLCIGEERNDLNASPALGPGGVYIAGESGGIFFVPYDYPLSAEGRRDPRSGSGPSAVLPAEGGVLAYTSPFGSSLASVPPSLDANAPLTLSLFVRKGGSTVLSALDPKSVKVRATGNPRLLANVSADRRFLTIVPDETWLGPEGGRVEVRVEAAYSVGLSRLGLKFFGGRRGGKVDQVFSLSIPPRARGAGRMPYAVPEGPGGQQAGFEFSRLSAPLPSMLPSWNQIGFDSLHYLAGTVAPLAPGPDGQARAIVWVIGGKLAAGATGAAAASTVVDPSLEVRYPLVLEYDGGLLTFRNHEGFKINFVGSWDMPFGFYRLAAKADPLSGSIRSALSLNAVALCDQIAFYGPFLKLMGMSEAATGRMTVAGGMKLARWQPPSTAPGAIEGCRFSLSATEAQVDLPAGPAKADHVFSLLLVDQAGGLPLPLYYTKRTKVEADDAGRVIRVALSFDQGEVKGGVRAILLVDTEPVAEAVLDLPAAGK